ncbi:ABC transporter substrate-binding protein [Paenibacillus pectinilyticus]|uniref:ABC transporter substrate-binding protein n=1 Tax=Paenibacillus pectinilyticus TaxID=512399 RepID=A0A1C1A6T7_9BACL|nr:extracellular solute-binding protein [Paenibacillus pectinilyticus]OCT16279.1 ABC transporter substrate-binding protein [Paenibacillus pectinilyticus]
MKKWIPATMATVLMASMLAACGTSTKTNEATGAQGTAAASTKPAEKTKFSIGLRTLAFGHVEKSPNINEDKWVKKLEELTNTDMNIVLVPHKDYEQKMIQMFATNDIPDVVQGSGSWSGKEMAGSVKAGVFQPLDDLLNKYGQNLLKKIPKESWNQVTYQGKIYAIPEFLSNPSRRSVFIRKDLLDKAGLGVPKTTDEYMAVLRKFKEMGVEFPYMGRENFKYSDVFFGSYDVYPYLSMLEQQGDQIVPKFFDTENMTKALQTYKTMYDDGLMNKEFATTNATVWKNAILAGKAGMWSMNANEVLQWEQQLRATVPTAKIDIIASPTGPDGSGGHYLYGPNTRAYFVNKSVKDAAGIIKFFDWMMSDEAEKFFTFGIEGDTYKTVDGKIEYKSPTDPAGIDEERYRQSFLWLVQDTTYNKGTLSLTEDGKKLMKTYDTTLANEGRDGINFEPRLDAYVKNPDIAPLSDQAPPVVLQHMVKMVYGKEPISDWPKVIEEWKSKGGNDVIKEATEKFKNKDSKDSDSTVTLSRRK